LGLAGVSRPEDMEVVKAIVSIIHQHPLVNVIYPHHEPAYGACLLALKALSGNW
jgi:hypothetical protein